MRLAEESLFGRFTETYEPADPVVLERCRFFGISVHGDVHDPRAVRFGNLHFRECHYQSANIDSVHLRDITIDGLRRGVGGALLSFGCVYERIVLRGLVKGLVINAASRGWPEAKDAGLPMELTRAEFDERHDGVEWSFDITELEGDDVTLRGIPSRLIKRNPDRHYVVRRDAIEPERLSRIDLTGTLFGVTLGGLLRSDWDDTVLMLPSRRHKMFEPSLVAIDRLRDAGFIS